MTAFLVTLLRLSILGSLLAGVLFLLKPVLRGRVSRTVSYYLWLLVLLRLCVPAGLTLPLPETNVTAPTAAPAVQTAGQSGNPAAPSQTAVPAPENASPAPVAAPAPAAEPPAQVTERLLTAIWGTGTLLVGGWYIHSYRRLARQVRKYAVPAAPEAQALLAELDPRGRVQFVVSPAVSTPLLLGVVHPTVVLPQGVMDPARLRDILTHELTHARRHDLLYKWFAAFAASVHWFNPLLPFIRREIGRACELACDEAAVRSLDAPARKHYGETLLLLAADAPAGALPLAVTLCEEKKALQERLVSIVKIHKRTPAAVLLTLALVLGIGGCSLVSGAKTAETNENASFGALSLSQGDGTLRLDMTQEEVEALLGEGAEFYSPLSSAGTGNTKMYSPPDGLLVVSYDRESYLRPYRLCSVRCMTNADYAAYIEDLLTPEAQKLYQEAEAFQFQVSGEAACGQTLEELKARFPGGTRYAYPTGQESDDLTTIYSVFQDGVAVCYYLTEKTGVYQIDILPEDRWYIPSDLDYFYHSVTGDGYFTELNDVDRQALRDTLGPGQPQGDALVFGSGADTIRLTETEHGYILEALGSNWRTSRGIHVGHTLADLNARYDGSVVTNEDGSFFRAEGEQFVLTFRLDASYTITSMRLEGKGEMV